MKELCELCGQEAFTERFVDDKREVTLCEGHSIMKIKEITLKLNLRPPTDTEERQMGKHTPRRTFRYPEDKWEQAGKKAAAEGITLTDILTASLDGYLVQEELEPRPKPVKKAAAG